MSHITRARSVPGKRRRTQQLHAAGALRSPRTRAKSTGPAPSSSSPAGSLAARRLRAPRRLKREDISVSRTTAYRYFPSTRALLVATYPHIRQPSLLGADAPADPRGRLAAVVDDHLRRILTFEPEIRTVLRLSLEAGAAPAGPPLPMNRGMRIGWIEDALAPLRDQLAPDDVRRLVLGIGATLGIEAFVWLTDIAGLPREEAAAVMRANALGLLEAALAPTEGG